MAASEIFFLMYIHMHFSASVHHPVSIIILF